MQRTHPTPVRQAAPFSPARAPSFARTASRWPSRGSVHPARRGESTRTASLPAARTYQCPARDFHSTPASTCGSRTPQAGESSARAAIAPVRACARARGTAPCTRLPAPRQVSARVHSQAAVPLDVGQRLLGVLPGVDACARRARARPGSRAGRYGAQAARAAVPVTSCGADGGPRSAGPGSVHRGRSAAGSPVPSRSSSTFQDAAVPAVRRARQRRGHPVRRQRCSGRGPRRRARADPVRTPRAPKEPSDSGRCRRCGPATSARRGAASAPSARAKSSATPPVPSLRLGVAHDAQPVVEQHHTAWSTSPAYSSCGGPIGGPGRGAGGRRDLHGRAGPRPDGERAAQQRACRSVRSPRAGQTEKSVRVDDCHAVAETSVSLAGIQGRLRPRGSARTAAPPHRPGPSRRRAARAAPRTPRAPRPPPAPPSVLAAAHQIGGPRLQRTRVELGGRRAERASPVRLGTRPASAERRRPGPADPRPRPAPGAPCRVGVGQPLQAAQHVGRAGGPGQRGQPLVQGEFVGAARAREEPQAPHLGQQRRQLRALRPGQPPQREPGLQGLAQHPAAVHTRSRGRRRPAPAGRPGSPAMASVAPAGAVRPRGSERWARACAVSTRRLRPRDGGSTRYAIRTSRG